MSLNIRKHDGPTIYAAFGTCYACRTNSKGAFVATGIDILGEGELEFCENCVKEIVEQLGFVAPQAVARYKGIVKRQEEWIDELEAIKAEHVALVAALNAANVRNPLEAAVRVEVTEPQDGD